MLNVFKMLFFGPWRKHICVNISKVHELDMFILSFVVREM